MCLALPSFVLPAKSFGQGGSSYVAPRIVKTLDENAMTQLKGNTPPLAQRQFDQGAVPDATPASRMLLVLKRSPEQETELKQLVNDQQNASSANFHKWLTAEEFGKRFGPADSDIAQVTVWLQSKGFTVNNVSRGKQVIDFSGTAGQLKVAFKTELHTYKSAGMVFHANSSDPQVPSALAPVIAGFASLNDIQPRSNATVMGTARMNAKTHAAVPQWNNAQQCDSVVNDQLVPFACTFYPPTPGDLAVQYNMNPVYKAGTTGKGVTIGVASASNIDLGIVQNYRTLFGFTNPSNLPLVTIDGDDPGQNGAAVEAYLDVEAASAMAPDATVNLYTSVDTLTTSGLVNAITRAVDDNTADIITLSYGECEQFLGSAGNQFFYQYWEQAAAQGQSVFVSTGDGGSAGCDSFDVVSQASLGLAVSGFASTPFNTAVGGTDFYYSQWQEGQQGPDLLAQVQAAWAPTLPSTYPNTTLLAPIQEQVWNEGYGQNILNFGFGFDIVAGSGGASGCTTGTGTDPDTGGYTICSGGYPKPSWQVGPGVPSDGARDLPDVSLFASSSVNLSFWPICASIYDCRADTSDPNYSIVVTAIGGTSAASPAMAGIMALVDQAQKGRQGNPNFNLYALAAQYPTSFNDVTLGSNNVPCSQGTPNCSLDSNGDGLYTLQQYSATAGYDQASGLGSVNVANLVANWGKIAYKSTTTTLSLGSTTITHGTPVTVKAGVTSSTGTPTGSVALLSTSTTPGQAGIGAIELTNGAATGSIASLPGGSYSVTGTYSGDGVYSASTSPSSTITVSPEASISSLVVTDYNNTVQPIVNTILASGATIPYDDQLILDVTVAGKSGQGAATGVVTFFDGTTSIGSKNVNSSGDAELITGALLPGSHTISTSYAGDDSFSASSTPAFAINFTQGVPTIYSTYPESYVNGQNVVYAGQPLLISSSIFGGSSSVAPTGTLTVGLAGFPSQTATLAPSYAGLYEGIAFATFTPVTPGTYPITFSYSGDANYAPKAGQSSSPVIVIAPTLAPSTTTVTTSTLSYGPDGVFTLKASVKGSIPGKIPTGQMAFLFTSFAASTPIDSNGNASVVLAGEDLLNGANIVYAQYPGDSVYAQSTSSQLTITADVGDYSLTTSNPNIEMKSGSTGTTTLYVSQLANNIISGLTGAVNLTCTPASPAITCSFASPAVTLLPNGAQANTTLTINSHVPVTSAQSLTPAGPHRQTQTIAGGFALAMLFFFIPKRRRKILHLVALGVLAVVGLGMTGCGNTTPPPAAPAPPVPTGNAAPGLYKVTVLGNLDSVQHSLTFNVTVQ